MDDMILIADDAEDFEFMAGKFDKFLLAVGLSLNAKKCHYTSVNADVNPEIWCTDEKGDRHQILRADESVPLLYLGYALRVDDCQAKLTTMWKTHNLIIEAKLRKAASRFVRSRFGPHEAINILNADITSVVPYFSYANWMPEGAPKSKRGQESTQDEEDSEPQAVNMKSLMQMLRKVTIKKLRLLPNTPKGAIFNSSRGLGFGINNLRALCSVAKIDNVLAALQSPCEICRLTTLDTIWEIQISKGWNVLDPDGASKTACTLSSFPAFYRECGEALRQANTRIEINRFFSPILERHPMLIVEGHIPVSRRLMLFKIFKDHDIRTLNDLLPGMINQHTGLNEISRQSIGRAIYQGKFVEASIDNIDNAQKSDTLRLFPNYLRKGLLDRIAKGDFNNIDSTSWMSPELCAARGSGGNMTAADGSAKDGKAGWAIVSNNGESVASAIGDGHDIGEAEAVGVLAALILSKSGVDVSVVSDAQGVISAINTLKEMVFRPKAYRETRNYSIIKTVVDEIRAREEDGLTVSLRKVQAHSSAQDPAHVLHGQADSLAKTNRNAEVRRILANPCLHNLPKAYVVTGGDCIRETKTHSFLLRVLDEFLLDQLLEDPKVSRHMKLWDLEDTWLEASKIDKHDQIRVFKSKMFCKSLPTPRNIQILNLVKYPGLYPGFRCPLCDNGTGDDFHIFCTCIALRDKRVRVHTDCRRAINQAAGAEVASANLVEFCLFPRMEENFKHGQVHQELRRKIEHKYGQEGVLRLARPIGEAIAKAYHLMWEGYTDLLVERKKDLNSRLKEVYNTSTKEIRQTFSFDNG